MTLGGSHVRLFGMLGGVTRLVVPDNLKSANHKASFYDPEVNRTYGMLAAHYEIGVLPARPRRPRDKAKVESGVLFARRYILGRMRNRPFFSLAEANRAIGEVMARMNDAVMRRLGVSRRQLTVRRAAASGGGVVSEACLIAVNPFIFGRGLRLPVNSAAPRAITYYTARTGQNRPGVPLRVD
jgi:hypothetical protein